MAKKSLDFKGKNKFKKNDVVIDMCGRRVIVLGRAIDHRLNMYVYRARLDRKGAAVFMMSREGFEDTHKKEQ